MARCGLVDVRVDSSACRDGTVARRGYQLVAHKIGYENFNTGNTSKNIMPVDVFMLGEGYHNNHHKFASSPNFAFRWFEIDPVYLFMRGLGFLGIVKLKPSFAKRVVTEF